MVKPNVTIAVRTQATTTSPRDNSGVWTVYDKPSTIGRTCCTACPPSHWVQ